MVTQPQTQTPVLQITSQSEAERLWKHTLFGAGTYVNMIEGYCRLDMPSVPTEAVQALVTRLQEVLKNIEAKNAIPSNSQ